jgi:hypothetical protein
MWNYDSQSVHVIAYHDPFIAYLLCAIDCKCDGRDWRAVLCIARYSLSFCATHPLLVCRVLHKPNVSSVVLEVQSEDPPLAYVPGLSGYCNPSSIESALLGEVVITQITTYTVLRFIFTKRVGWSVASTSSLASGLYLGGENDKTYD